MNSKFNIRYIIFLISGKQNWGGGGGEGEEVGGGGGAKD